MAWALANEGFWEEVGLLSFPGDLYWCFSRGAIAGNLAGRLMYGGHLFNELAVSAVFC